MSAQITPPLRETFCEKIITQLYFFSMPSQKKLSHASHPSTIGQHTAGADRSKANQKLKWTRSALIVMKNDEAFSANKATPSQCKTNMNSLKWHRA